MKIISDPIYFDKELTIPSPYTSNPEMDGTASPGTSSLWSRGDHRHPSDTTKQDLLTFDSSPTTNSNNPVTSSGIYNYVVSLLPQETATGNPANFPDGANNVAVTNLVVNIDFVQEGNGIASSANVRPIVSYTGLTLSHSGQDTSDPEELTISWQNVAGSIAEGTLDILTGVLTVTRVFLNNNSIEFNGSMSTYIQGRIIPPHSCTTPISNRFSDAVPSGTVGRMSLSGGVLYFNIPSSEVESPDTTGLRTWANDYHAQFSVVLTTPQTYQLTAHQVTTLLGENNFWSDTGDVNIQYHADIQLYVETQLLADNTSLNSTNALHSNLLNSIVDPSNAEESSEDSSEESSEESSEDSSEESSEESSR